MGIHPMEASDAVLVRLVLDGDARAYAGLVERYRDRLARYAMHMLGVREDAEEALQDAFLRAYRALPRCDPPERFGPWLFAILANRCRTAGARRARRQAPVSHEEAVAEEPTAISAEDRTAWREAIALALERLEPKYREAFLLKHVEEMTYEEMARITGASVPALKMRVKRACERLRGLLQEAERVGA
jgi:RNA polymerase sigma-70 factor, ECF subfamily